MIRRHDLRLNDVYHQVSLGIQQLHFNGFAHCDICLDNIFVDSIEEGGHIFIGDLEYCRLKDELPPKNIRRSDCRARTAEELDNFQLEIFKEELSKICK